MKYKLILGFVFVLNAQAQNYQSYEDMFRTVNGLTPSTRSLAMGNSGVTGNGELADVWLNPASLLQMQCRLQTQYSHTAPIWLDPISQQNFFGFGVKFSKKMAISYTRFKYSVWHPMLGVASSKDSIYPDYMGESNNHFALARSIGKGLVLGFAYNHLNHFMDKAKTSNPVFDLGGTYEKVLKRDKQEKPIRKLQLGLAIKNIFGREFTITYWGGTKEAFQITGNIKGGASWNQIWDVNHLITGKSTMIPAADRTIALTFQSEYIKFIHNTDKSTSEPIKYWGLYSGAELALLNVIMLRGGYRYEKRFGTEDMSAIINLPYLRGLTWGVGFKVPFHYMTSVQLPFDLFFDYFTRKQFTFYKSYSPLKDLPFTSLSLRLNWFVSKSH